MTTEAKQQQLDWRRSKVLELSSQGYSEREVSEVLKVSDSAVHRDLVFIRRQAKENLQKHIDERIPEELEKAMAGMNTVLKMTSHIANTVEDPRTKLQALSLMNEVYKQRIELSTNGVVIRDALDYVNNKTRELSSAAEKKLSKEQEGESEGSESKESEEPDYGEEEELEEGQEKDAGEFEEEKEKTTNDVF
jgi:glucan phosphorylase